MEPKRLISRILESAFLFFISALLIKLGILYLVSVWQFLVILGGITLLLIILHRIRKYKKGSEDW